LGKKRCRFVQYQIFIFEIFDFLFFSGDPLITTPTGNTEQQSGQSRGRTFLCRMRTNDESTPYITMVVSVALHRDSSGSDKTFLICIARRPPINELKDKSSILGFDQFSSRIDLQYNIESLDSR